MRAAALALLLSLTAGAEEPAREVFEVERGTLQLRGGASLEVMGGAYLPSLTLLATGKEMAALRAENEALKQAPVATPASLTVAVLVGLAVGVAGGAALVAWVRR